MSQPKYKGLSPSQFFYRNREIAGFSNPARALYQTVRELVENSLDATETYGILPEIRISIKPLDNAPDKVEVTVEDNGIGIPIDEVPNVFGRVFYGSKYVLRQARGVFGLGIKMAVLYAQITTGKPIKVVSSTPDSPVVYEYQLMIDIEKNIPIIFDINVKRKTEKYHGTKVSLSLSGNWSQSRIRILEYLRRTALIAPYATIVVEIPEDTIVYERSTKTIPEPPQEGKPHPRGVDVEMLKRMVENYPENITLEEFLAHEFEGVGEKTARSFLKWAGYTRRTRIKSLSLRQLSELSDKMRWFTGWRRPRALTLSPLGEKLLKRGIDGILKPEVSFAVTRKPSSYGGNPFIVEAGVAYGGEIPPSNQPQLYRFANRIPLLYDEGADVSRKVVDRIDWTIYKVRFPAPLAVVVHLCSTKIPFKGVGKEAIADVPEIEREIEIVVREAARKLKAYLTRKAKEMELKRKEVTIRKYIPEVARSLGYILGKEDSWRRMLENILERELKKRGEVVVPGAE